METVLLLLIIIAPVTAAVRGFGRRGTWLGLSAVALMLAIASHVVATRMAGRALGQLDERMSIAPSTEFAAEQEKAPAASQPEPGGRAAAGKQQASTRRSGYSNRATRTFASAFLGLLLSGLLYRPRPRAPEEVAAPAGAPSTPPSVALEKAPAVLCANTREVQGVTVLDLSGKLVLGEGCDILRKHLGLLWAADTKRILLNLRDVDRVDSAGIGILVEAVIETAKGGGQLKLVNLPKLVRGVLMVHRLLSAFEIYDSEEQAVASFNS